MITCSLSSHNSHSTPSPPSLFLSLETQTLISLSIKTLTPSPPQLHQLLRKPTLLLFLFIFIYIYTQSVYIFIYIYSYRKEMEAINENIPKLSLFSLPSLQSSGDSEPPGSMSPPLRSSASVPFLWEEAPGKPRRCSSCNTAGDLPADEITTKSLGLPPRLLAAVEMKFTNMPSPTTVLHGPDAGRSMSFRIPESLDRRVARSDQRNGYFGSARWGSFRRSKGILGASFDISSSRVESVDGSEGNGVVFGGGAGSYDHHEKVKVVRVRRRSSFLSLSHTKSSSHLLVCDFFFFFCNFFSVT